ncbi:DNA topoisomerase (ATP-hydrolyzing) [Flexivirga endophytica]|uniref:DNA topoisomerase (ATP-hydrolyzing) n=1 Tax=Flexivirga endophytica TaxID=1849103 RepID=A0A916SWU1_9MICO|nr:DNA topoisomerase IV subunit A [Flexivirga endophytica]GGB20921.1 DNA topoisomerase (ATP-hydrolyzing) [Flexivirga endophytica]GHB58725.1 DNA topoisomerase (ATP-hydrolyzing) [Flexivirga endophytica]
MARKKTSDTEYIDDAQQNIVDIDVDDEMQSAYLEYAYSVIYSRAIPDARDGLKPVQRRILYAMDEMRLYPERNHVKSSRVVGEVMGKYHPHGDTAIYDAIVRQAQDFTMRLPLVDGHGNFGSLDNGPAASRYTEVRLAGAALELTRSLNENTVDFVPNYDESEQQPDVLPAAFPNLLVNGASGIAVGMATNMAPHNLGEVVAAARHLINHPDSSLDDLMKFVPGPDLPCGGRIVGLDGIRDAYLTGRGSFRTRATCTIENLTPRRKSIVVTELPYMVGAEKVIERMKDLVQAKKLQGISDVNDLSDMKGMKLVIDVKNGFNPEAVLEALYKHTPMEESFGINNVALVEGQPRTLGLKELLTVYVDFRIDVVRRRTAFRLKKATDRLHLVNGLLTAILDIDEVIQVIRTSDDAETARTRLMQVFDLDQVQADYILELRLRRLTKFSRIELEKEQTELREQIAALQAILDDEKLLRKTVSNELADVVKTHGTPRRTVLLEGNGIKTAATAAPLEVSDDPCWVLLSSSGLLARTTDDTPLSSDGARRKHDLVTSRVRTSARGDFGVVTSGGRMVRLNAIDLPTLPPTNDAPVLAGGAPLAAYIDLGKGEQPLALASLSPESKGLAIGTERGVVKRVNPDYPGKDSFEVISLKDSDKVVGAVDVVTGEEDLTFITSDAHLLRYAASLVRPQGRSGGGMAGVKLGAGARALWFGSVDTSAPAVVVTGAGSADALPGTGPKSVKVTPYDEYPTKGRATGGVRCQRFVRGEDELVIAWAGTAPARAASPTGAAVELPAADGKRDGSGVPPAGQIAAVGGSFPAASAE